MHKVAVHKKLLAHNLAVDMHFDFGEVGMTFVDPTDFEILVGPEMWAVVLK